MHDFRCSDPDKMHYGEMADRVRYLKESSEGVSQMCKIMEDMRDEARAEGRAEGRADLSPEDIQALRRGQTVTA